MDAAPVLEATAWAVFLGCATPKRLAFQQGTPYKMAEKRLQRALNAGLIVRARRGFFVYAPVLIPGRRRRGSA